MASSVKIPNLITGIIISLLLLLSFTGGIYGVIRHRESNRKKRMQSILKHELAVEQARMAVLNVQREGERRGRKRQGKKGEERGEGDLGVQKLQVDGNERDLETEIEKVRISINGIEVDGGKDYEGFEAAELDGDDKKIEGLHELPAYKRTAEATEEGDAGPARKKRNR